MSKNTAPANKIITMKIKLSNPLISCICITNNRPELLLKAIYCFDGQIYPNRELIISYPENDIITEDIIARLIKFSLLRIIPLKRDPGYSIGHARNHAIAHSNGNYVCMWDDDDIHNFHRISHQYSEMEKHSCQGGIITGAAIYDTMTQRAYISMPNNWTGTLICKKDFILSHPYSDSNIHEASNLIESLEIKNLLHKIQDFPYLYTFVYHQHNLTDYADVQNIIYKSQYLDDQSRDGIRSQFEFEINLPA